MRVDLVITGLLFMLVTRSIAQDIDVQGHRGARGIYPENSIPGFVYAIEQGVTTLEMDVVISADGQVVLSHEPWMNSGICLGPGGEELNDDHDSWNIYRMNYADIERFDCGSKGNTDFPEQGKIPVSKPLLADVIRTAERYMKGHTGYEFDYSIEIKSSEEGDGIFHPGPEEFSDIVFNLLDQYLPWDRIIIQSFDFRVLQYWHKTHPEVRLAALVENMRSPDTNIGALGFEPAIYSPYYELLTKKVVDELHERDILVIPWTLNDEAMIKEYVKMGVDGIITDYPNRARELGLTRTFNKNQEK